MYFRYDEKTILLLLSGTDFFVTFKALKPMTFNGTFSVKIHALEKTNNRF